MPATEFLERYGGQTTAQLLALADRYRVDSIVLAFEDAVARKRKAGPISREERWLLAVEAYERELNTGGAEQFFVNASVEFTPVIVEALEAVGCPRNAEAVRALLAILVPEGAPNAEVAAQSVLEAKPATVAALETCTDTFFGAGEPIAEQLFDWIRAHPDAIRIGLQ